MTYIVRRYIYKGLEEDTRKEKENEPSKISKKTK